MPGPLICGMLALRLTAPDASKSIKYSPVREGEAPAEPNFAAKTVKTAQQGMALT
jgi:hypothetical protein